MHIIIITSFGISVSLESLPVEGEKYSYAKMCFYYYLYNIFLSFMSMILLVWTVDRTTLDDVYLQRRKGQSEQSLFKRKWTTKHVFKTGEPALDKSIFYVSERKVKGKGGQIY